MSDAMEMILRHWDKCNELEDNLHTVALKNDIQRIKKFLDAGKDVNKPKFNFDFTLLHAVAFENRGESHFEVEVAELLLKNGADVNAKDCGDETPFHFLLKKGNLKIVKLFLSFKVDINCVRNDGTTLLFPAVGHNKNLDVVQAAIDRHGIGCKP